MSNQVTIGGNTYPVVILGDKDSGAPINPGGGSGGGGDASAANQVTGNASLASIDGKTPALGQQIAGASTPVVLTAAQLATLTPPAAIAGFATAAKQPALGTGVMAGSTPVTIATDDTVIGSTTDAVVAGGAAGSLSAKIRRLTTDIAALLTRWPAALGTGTAAQSLPVTLATDGQFVTSTGSVTETAPATDTASSGLNGRLQRIAQRLTSFLALFTATASADANRLPVDQRDGLAVTGSVSSAAVLFTQDMVGYESITVQVTNAGTTCTITYEQSEDQTTWFVAPGLNVASTTGVLASTTTTAQGIKFARGLRYFRARVSSYTSGTVAVQGTLSKAPITLAGAVNLASVGVGSVPVSGAAAHAAAISASPVRLGARGRTSNYAAVTNDQTADLITTLVGALISKPYSIPEADWNYAAAASGISNTTTAVTIAAAAGAGIRNYLTGLQLSAAALGAATELAIRDGAGGTVLWRAFIGTSGLPAQSVTFPNPLKSTANTLLEIVTLTASITGSVYANAQGYTAP